MAAAKFDGPMEYPVEGYLPVGRGMGKQWESELVGGIPTHLKNMKVNWDD